MVAVGQAMIPCFKDVCTKTCSKDHYAGRQAPKRLTAIAVLKSTTRLRSSTATTREVVLLEGGVEGRAVSLWDRRVQGTWLPAGVPTAHQRAVGTWPPSEAELAANDVSDADAPWRSGGKSDRRAVAGPTASLRSRVPPPPPPYRRTSATGRAGAGDSPSKVCV